ncbi:glycoside hydrolase family 3 N-terminal domain-containing protein [Vibrio crassostreae]|uniref:glycoside hydrolase family 3 N-terminal domain-containing protein n=1 Tax=Vibrio crassostreae TaxID=246167 RepID=UPI000F498FB6|nr:glycoside hydrolase family 3 N-terminal domain-containing protein [Vibrio crassostreae]ROR21120.1 beta-glucosidase [Vibrio crassostreae]TCV30858.1 beta-glucosidase [Vibrio crassostreae]
MCIYKNNDYTTNERVKDLLSKMTLDEKVAQLGAQWLILDENGDHQERELEMSSNSISRTVQEKLMHGLGQITRPLGTHTVGAKQGVQALNQLQKHLIENTRLGIPAIPHEECLVGLMAQGATLYPSSLNYGHTWNPELMEKVAEDIGRQARAVGAKQGLAPVLDVSRDVRWGRTEETLAEDPYLVGVMATSYVKGLQGKDRDLIATLKHYVGHSASEGARNHAPVNLGFKELNDTFLLPFEMAVKLGNAGSIMPAYHDIDGEPCHSSEFLMTEVLRNQWGFDGLIVADYGGVELLSEHHATAKDRVDAAAQAFNAGLDVELPDDACTTYISEAIEQKLITLEKIDAIVWRVLAMKFDLGLFENPYTPVPTEPLHNETSDKLAYQAASESIVLLKNNGQLPLSKDSKVALLGATADDPLALLGGYSFPVHLILSGNDSSERVAKSIKEAMEQRVTLIGYQKGCDILTERHGGAPVFPGDVDMAVTQDKTSPVSMDTSKIASATSIISDADVAVVCVGDLAGLFQTGTIGEGSDADTLDLPGVQQKLLNAALDSGKPVVVVVTGGRPYCLGRAEDEAAAIVYGWAPGQRGADAIADVLTGVTNPSGKLTLSIPKNVGAVPYFYNHKLKSAGTPIAFHFGSRFNFGFGLSYTNFDYSNATLNKTDYGFDESVTLSIDITNTGERDGTEIVQLYARDQVCSVVRPVKELKGFHKVFLAAGETKTVTFTLPIHMLSFTDSSNRRVVEGGEFDLMLGRSSQEIESRHVINVLPGKKVLPRDWNMVCEAHSS